MTQRYRTRQGIFNTAYRGLASQGFEKSEKPFIAGRSKCLYRGPNGRKCAIGWCIADKNYKGGFEYKDLSDLVDVARINPMDTKFAANLQGAHDFAQGPYDMRRLLHEFAAAYNLTIPSLPNTHQQSGDRHLSQRVAVAGEGK